MRLLALGFLIVLPGWLHAQAPVPDESEPQPVAWFLTPLHLPHECLAPVEINRVDGEARNVPARGFAIEPGPHRVNGRAALDTRRCRPLASDLAIPRADDLVLDVEAGKAYYIAYDRSHPDAKNWRLVVWKVEDVPTVTSIESDAGEDGIGEPVIVQ